MRMIKQNYMTLIGVSLILVSLMSINSLGRLSFLEDSAIASVIVGCEDDWRDNNFLCSMFYSQCPPGGYYETETTSSGFCRCLYNYWNCPEYDVNCSTNTPVNCHRTWSFPQPNCKGLGWSTGWSQEDLVCELSYD